MKLTKHFVERWKERVGLFDEDLIGRLVKTAQIVQQYRVAYTPRGLPLVILELRWIPEIGAIVKRDAKNDTLVTVVTQAAIEN